jgi:hypothetical protein
VEVFFIYSFFLAQSVYELKQRHSYVFNVVEEKALKRLKGKEKKRKGKKQIVLGHRCYLFRSTELAFIRAQKDRGGVTRIRGPAVEIR